MPSTTTPTSAYNGWANYETWCVHLWLSNTQKDYLTIKNLIAKKKDVYTASQAIKAHVEKLHPLRDRSSLFADLLNAALSEVDWVEITKTFKEE
jgi:hypothetical protein